MKVLDFWPYFAGHRVLVPGYAERLQPLEIIESGAGGIDPLLKSIEEHRPDVLIGEFGIRSHTSATISHDEMFFRELREKHACLPVVMLGTSGYSERWREVADELQFYYQRMPELLTYEILMPAIKGAQQLVSEVAQ